MDIYIVAMHGYNVSGLKSEPDFKGTDPQTGGFTLGGQLCLHYMFSDKIGAFTEVGHNISYLTLGLAIKM